MARTKGAKDLIPRKRKGDETREIVVPALEMLPSGRNAKVWHRTAIRMYALGRDISEIAKELNKKPETVKKAIHTHPELVDLCIKELAQPEKMFLPMMPKAAKVYRQILDHDTENADAATMRVQAGVAGDLFDRAYGRPVQRNINEGHHEITITFTDDSESASKNEATILEQLGVVSASS